MMEQGIGGALRRWRAARGLSQRALAARAGVDYTSIARIETGRQDPTVGSLARLAKALGTTVAGLFGKPPLDRQPNARRRRKGGGP